MVMDGLIWRYYLDGKGSATGCRSYTVDGFTFYSCDNLCSHTWREIPEHGGVALVTYHKDRGLSIHAGQAPQVPEYIERIIDKTLTAAYELLSQEQADALLENIIKILRGYVKRLGNEFYVWQPSTDYPYGTWGLEPFLDVMGMTYEEALADKLIKFGREVQQPEWSAVIQEAVHTPDFPEVRAPRRRTRDFDPVHARLVYDDQTAKDVIEVYYKDVLVDIVRNL